MKKVGIIFAMKEELDALLNVLTLIKEYSIFDLTFYECKLDNKDIVLVESGIGKVNSARTTQILIDKFEIEFVDTKKIFAEDQLFCLCYLTHCSKLKMLDICLYNYVQRDGSIMDKSVKEKNYHFAQTNELSKYLYEYYKKWEKEN